MNLGTLLAAGKSIMNGRTDVSYRSSKQIYLPKFGSPKNPFKTETAASPAETAGESAAPSMPAAVLNSTLMPAATPSTMPRATRAAIPAAHDTAVVNQPVVVVHKFPGMYEKKKTGWTAVASSLTSALHAVSPKAAKSFLSGTAKAERAVSQPEFTLDCVRPVHNDLRDAEVEVVTMKSGAGAPKTPVAKKPLEVLGERLFGVQTS